MPLPSPVFVRHADTNTLAERVPAQDTETARAVRLLSGRHAGKVVLWRADKAVSVSKPPALAAAGSRRAPAGQGEAR